MTMNNPFYTVIQNELVKVVESRGDRLVLRDPMLDPDKQSEQIEEFIKMKVDGIFINPVDSITIEESLQEAKDAGIPVIVIDCPMDTSKVRPVLFIQIILKLVFFGQKTLLQNLKGQCRIDQTFRGSKRKGSY